MRAFVERNRKNRTDMDATKYDSCLPSDDGTSTDEENTEKRGKRSIVLPGTWYIAVEYSPSISNLDRCTTHHISVPFLQCMCIEHFYDRFFRMASSSSSNKPSGNLS